MRRKGSLARWLVVSTAALGPVGCAVGASLDEVETIRVDASSEARPETDGAAAGDAGDADERGADGAAGDASEPSDGAGSDADARDDVSVGSDEAGEAGGGDAAAAADADSGTDGGGKTDAAGDTDSGDGGGAVCEANTFACAGAAQRTIQACVGGVWTYQRDCDGTKLCDTSLAPTVFERCVEQVPACAGQLPGDYVCDGAKLVQCGPDLVTSTSVDCPSAKLCALHVGAKCAVCVDGEYQCSGAELKQCAADHLSFTTKTTCANAALCNAGAGQCTSATCVPNQYRCTGTDLEVCNAEQTGFEKVTKCASADLCDAPSGSCTICVPNAATCADGGHPKTCTSDGQTWSTSACPADKSHCTGAGKCVECASPADCPAPADPCQAATCSSSGVCGTQPKTGATCDDGNACTTGDKCEATGACSGTPKSCAAADQCHTAGTCDPSTGACITSVKTGTSCDDGDACTKDDKCDASGVCGGTSYTCDSPPDPQCPVAGTCNGDGTCTYKQDPSCIRLTKLDQVCKLINNKNMDDPTSNNTHGKANVRGSGLGIPVTHKDGNIYLFFGDTTGKTIWKWGESLPDAVGYATSTASQVAANPSLLCNGLQFVISDGTNFAGAYMLPNSLPAGYVNNPAGQQGKNNFPNIPGSGELPSGAISNGNSIYVFYTTVTSWQNAEPKGSYLARWTSPSKTNLPNYDTLYKIDERFDSSGALRGDFINIAPVAVGNYVYLYGTGAFRQSTVHLARKLLSKLDSAGSFESYDAASKKWVGANAAAAPIVGNTKMGELSVRYFPTVAGGIYVMMNQEVTASGNFIMARFASAAEGPFSDPVAVAQMEDAAFRQKYCCDSSTACNGAQMFNCSGTGAFYAPYMLPEPIKNADGSFTVSFTVSTWDPYNVALMQATFK